MPNHSFIAVKDAIGTGDSFYGKLNVTVSNDEGTYLYEDVYVVANYNIGYMQMEISIMWEDDPSQPDYTDFGLHKGYNSNFQDFEYRDGYLSWEDGDNKISLRFR